MTCDNEDSAAAALLPLLEVLTSGDDGRFRDALQLLLNTAMLGRILAANTRICPVCR